MANLIQKLKSGAALCTMLLATGCSYLQGVTRLMTDEHYRSDLSGLISYSQQKPVISKEEMERMKQDTLKNIELTDESLALYQEEIERRNYEYSR